MEPTRKLRTLSGPGLVIYPVTMTFAAVDWLMSLEKDWYSTMFAVMICIGQILSALAFVILLVSSATRSRQLGPIISTEDTLHKIGNLLLAFTMMWAYLEFGTAAHYLVRKFAARNFVVPPSHRGRLALGLRLPVSLQLLHPIFLAADAACQKAGADLGDRRRMHPGRAYRRCVVDDRAQSASGTFLFYVVGNCHLRWHRRNLVSRIFVEPAKKTNRATE